MSFACTGVIFAEERYGNERSADAESPVVKITGARTGDRTVTYDRGSWVFWRWTAIWGASGGWPASRNSSPTVAPGRTIPYSRTWVVVDPDARL